MDLYLQAAATLFALVNPVVCAMMFTTTSPGGTRAELLRDATAAMAVVTVVLCVAAFAGAPILRVFGISLDAFSVAGGGVLVFIGLSMLGGPHASSQAANAPKAGGASRLGPLILFAASPGTITGVMTIVAAHKQGVIPYTALLAIAIVLGVTWALLVAVSFFGGGKPSTASLGRDMVSRYMGLIVAAMGIQFALTGYKSFMAA